MMGRYEYNQAEQELNAVLGFQDAQLKDISMPDMSDAEKTISSSEALLESLGYDLPHGDNAIDEHPLQLKTIPRVTVLPSWEALLSEATATGHSNDTLESLFSEEELRANSEAIRRLNAEYDTIHQLDQLDIAISAGAGLLAAAIDILLVGFPKKTGEGVKAGPLSNYIRDHIENSLSPEQIRRLERASKVPYDAPINDGFTTTRVEGLGPGMHRLYSLGHDPLLGLVVGVSDILTGQMTTIDKNGKVVVQAIERYAHLQKTDIVQALLTQILHFFSDVTTPAGLPAPGTALFNLMQFGDIGKERATIAEIVQGMYYEGYDFVQFCAQSIPVAVSEVVVRFAYALRKIKGGTPVKEAIPFSTDRSRHPKLGTMLFISHSIATAANAGRIAFTKDPMAISYAQWIAFAKYSYQQLKWVLLEKPEARDKFVRTEITEQTQEVYDEIDRMLGELEDKMILL